HVPRRCKVVPFRPGALYNDGGIVDSVELLVSPAVRVEDLHVRPDPKTGKIGIRAKVTSFLSEPVTGQIELTVAPARSGETLQATRLQRQFSPGDTLVETELQIESPRLWELNDPFLYRVTARVEAADSRSFDEQSTRCGFRDFRFENGCFRLNGRRIFLKSSHTATHYPIGLHWPHDPDLARRELITMKTMGFNAIRFFCAVPARYQLDLCDEMGFMIYEESFAGWFLEDSPKMGERFDREIAEMIRRDRNHPSVVMWGLLNETPDGPVFRHAVGMLPLVRSLDDTRVVMLNSGRWDAASGRPLAGISLWRMPAGLEPNLTYNATEGTIRSLGVTWEPGRLGLHPGPNGEPCVLRWTAPVAGQYAISATFLSIAEKATTDVHVLHNGKSLLSSFINLSGQGREITCRKAVTAEKGEAIDFVVGWGNRTHGADSTGLEARIEGADGKVHDPGADFRTDRNSNGAWSYGYLAPSAEPDVSTFTAYTEGKTVPKSDSSTIGSLSNPGSRAWEDVLSDQHPYKRVPHTASIIRELRTVDGDGKPVFVSEYGIGSSLDLARMVRRYEQLGAAEVEDAQWYRERLNRFLEDWRRWNLDDTFASPEDYFTRCLARMADQRKLGLNAIRSNPAVVGYSMTGTTDCGDAGEGVLTLFRHLKPGSTDALFDGWYPLRWCLFVEPVNVYRKTSVRLEAVLANEDMLRPGKYPVRFQVVGPGAHSVFERKLTLTIPQREDEAEPPMAWEVFSADVPIDGPPGKYRFLATFEQGAAAAGGQIEFYVADPAELPAVETEVVLWSEDPELAEWLAGRNVRVRAYSTEAPTAREVILVSHRPAAPGGAVAFAELARRIARGSTTVFLCPEIFAKGDQPTAWVPLADKGALAGLPSWLYHKDEWAKRHPIFDGLPAGDLMDYTFYREIIPDMAWTGLEAPAEVVAGAINTSIDYSAGLFVSVQSLGAGRFVLTTLQIRDNLGRPAADRLLLNMLRHGARDVTQPPADLPPDFDAQLKAIGYQQ
ncbi:MAG: glycoside hydrolase family 2 TIM barrel-domain containing protein, partial [Planctomycetota bacterium]